MSKVTTRDCIQFIIAEVVMNELADPKNWKRIEKKTIDKSTVNESVIRVFKNNKTGLEVEVMEKDGVINRELVIFNDQWFKPNNPEDDWEGAKILFCLTKDVSNSKYTSRNYDVYQMYVTENGYYERHHHLDDGIDTSPICDLLKKNGFECGEFIEGGIEFAKNTNIDALKKYLGKSKVFVTNDTFQKRMESPDYEVINIAKEK